ncbi:Filamin-A-like [Oopsacas minuta]|uniref:Filamin-A-like n=1 Tax=Oopsacas minuta TaxID=111878 RepID=A0AAV7KGW7_9METZ|nr:Filamin-A-like [Oopsacas minuta]
MASSSSFTKLDAVDDTWKQIQITTFTNWFNNRLRGNLKESKNQVHDLFSDLKDGLMLADLINKLAAPKVVQKVNKNPKFNSQSLENIGASLNFITQQKVRLVNIGEYSSFIIQLFVCD